MLSVVEARVLGCLLEKERTVADQYPLTLNALVAACNQASSREPVMRLDEHEVTAAIASLKAAGLARLVHPSHGRSATRYRQVADEAWGLDPSQAAVLTVLLLRGPQTPAELRSRAERLLAMSLDEVHAALDGLAGAGRAEQLERLPGQQAARWRQVVADEAGTMPAATVVGPAPDGSADLEPSVPVPTSDGAVLARLHDLEARVARLEAALSDLLRAAGPT